MLKERIFTALILVVLALLDIFLASPIVWEMTVLVLSVLAAWEWSSLAKVVNSSKRILYVAVVTSMTWLGIEAFSYGLFQVLAVLQLIVFISYVSAYQIKAGQLKVPAAGLNLATGAISIVLFAFALVSLRELYGPSVLLLTLLAIWAIDSGAYFAGRKFGKHKLAVYVSPGKTWEGVFGGALFTFTFLFSVMSVFQTTYNFPILGMALMLTVVAMVSVFGDLFESVLKRQAGLKDSGNLLPGHGGVLDRIDSLILALPAILLLWLSLPKLAPEI